MNIAICGPNLRDQSKGQFHVHRADCLDFCYSDEPEYRNSWTIEGVSSKKQVVIEIYPPEDFEYDAEVPAELALMQADIYFFPCCKELS